MRRVIPFKRKENVDELLSQVLAVPRSGGLEPDPAIRNAVVAQMSARERGGFNVLRSFRFRCAGPFIKWLLRWGLSCLLFWVSASRSPIPRRHGLPNRQLLLWIRAGPILPGFRFQIRFHNAVLSIFFPLRVL